MDRLENIQMQLVEWIISTNVETFAILHVALEGKGHDGFERRLILAKGFVSKGKLWFTHTQ